MNIPFFTKRTIIAMLLMIAAVVPASGAVPGVSYQQGSDKDVAEVKAVFDAILTAANTRDIATLDQYYDPNLTIIDSGGLTRGWQTYKDTWLDGQYAAVTSNTVPHAVDQLGISVQGAMSWVTYRFTTNAKTANGDKTFAGYGTVVLTWDSVDGWRAVHIQSSARELQPGETVP